MIGIRIKAGLVALCVMSIAACDDGLTPEQKIEKQVKESVHALTADERGRAQTNAKAFFEKTWANAGNQRGQFNECRPSDSNFNGLVTCHGFVPKLSGGFDEVKRYCGYTAELVGCSDEDSVK